MKRKLILFLSLLYLPSAICGLSYQHKVKIRGCRPEVAMRLNRFIHVSVLSLGLKKLKRINLNLYKQSVKRLKSKTLVVSCKKSGVGIFSHRKKRFLLRNKIFLGDSLDELLLTLKSGNQRQKERFKNFIFHEFLHFFRIDNNPAEIHNREAVQSEYDFVYACAGAVFRNVIEIAFGFNEELATKVCSEAGEKDLLINIK